MQVCSHPVSQVSLRRLLPEAQWLGPDDDVSVGACVCDSRQAGPGVLFAALAGSRCDGHDFIGEAVARGATAILSQRPATEFGLPNCVVADSRDAYGRVCQALAGNPSHRLKLVGSDRHQRQDHHQLPAGQRAGHGGAPGGVAGDTGLLRRRDLRAGVLDHAAAGRAGRLAGPHGRQRLHPRGDGSLQPCPEPVAGGGRPL